MNRTKNRAEIRGFVGRYIKLPAKRGDPARFDVATVERHRTESGELVTDKNWHTIRTFDVDKVEDEIHTGALVEVMGRMDTTLVDRKYKHVELTADSFEVLLTQDQRDTLRDVYEEDHNDEEVLARS